MEREQLCFHDDHRELLSLGIVVGFFSLGSMACAAASVWIVPVSGVKPASLAVAFDPWVFFLQEFFFTFLCFLPSLLSHSPAGRLVIPLFYLANGFFFSFSLFVMRAGGVGVRQLLSTFILPSVLFLPALFLSGRAGVLWLLTASHADRGLRLTAWDDAGGQLAAAGLLAAGSVFLRFFCFGLFDTCFR